MSNDNHSVIKLENVGKKFRLSHQNKRHVENLLSRMPWNANTEEYWALKDINIDIKQGNVVGIIGRNGAGKTTLLNMLAGTLPLNEGRMDVKGRVSSMLSLGAGFRDELSAKENIFLNGLILGMSNKEVKEKFNDIVEFSELEEFLDIPIHAYSQGMQLRLGFSIAIHVDFDILLIDEVIAVGDIAFQKKCYERMAELRRSRKTILLSTHSLDVIERMCDLVYLLENGRLVLGGDPEEVLSYYRRLSNEKRFSKNK